MTLLYLQKCEPRSTILMAFLLNLRGGRGNREELELSHPQFQVLLNKINREFHMAASYTKQRLNSKKFCVLGL